MVTISFFSQDSTLGQGYLKISNVILDFAYVVIDTLDKCIVKKY